jgi:hypothetical protein
VPKLIREREIEVLTQSGEWVKGKTKGNQQEVENFERDNEEWIRKNKKALRWITNAIKGPTITLVKHCKTAKEAWENLKAEFKPVNTMLASILRKRIITYSCEEDMNVNEWIMNMRTLYDQLIDADPNALTDEDFGKTLLDLLPLTSSTWRNFISGRRESLTKPNTKSRVVIEAIKTEWFINHKDDEDVLAKVYSAKANSPRKRSARNGSDQPRDDK